MLAPEVWNFRPPPSSNRWKTVGSEKELNNAVASQYFNHFVAVTIPDSLIVPPSIQSVLKEDGQFYHVEDLPACELVQHEFVELFIKKGQLTVLSVGTRLDVDDCMVITPTGKLIFSLQKETFQMLGINRKRKLAHRQISDNYIVDIDLTSDSFHPGKNNYERVVSMLKEKNLRFSVIAAWEPHETRICPSSLAAYLSGKGFRVKECNVKIKHRNQYNVCVPDLHDESDCDVLVEWLGAFNMECNIPKVPDGFTTTYGVPEAHTEFGQVSYFEASGLFTSTKIRKLLEQIRAYVRSDMSPATWLALHVSGFEDSVVNRGEKEHFFYVNGDYHYTIFFRRDEAPILCTHTSSTRKPRAWSKKAR